MMSLIQDKNQWMDERGIDRESGLSQVPAQCDFSTPCPHQHPETWKCRWDGLMKPEGKCQPHTFEHRPMKWGRHASGFYSTIRCMVSNKQIENEKE